MTNKRREMRSPARRQFLKGSAAFTGALGTASLLPSANAAARNRIDLAQAAPQQATRATPGASPTKVQASVVPEITLDQFLALSRTLTGIHGLEADLGDELLTRCVLVDSIGSQLKALVDLHGSLTGGNAQVEQAMREKLQAAGELFSAAEQIIYLWYVGAFYTVANGVWEYGPPSHYYRGKVWRVLHVNVPITAGPSPKFWATKPKWAR